MKVVYHAEDKSSETGVDHLNVLETTRTQHKSISHDNNDCSLKDKVKDWVARSRTKVSRSTPRSKGLRPMLRLGVSRP